jgi:diguanylate cyclase (GGDEF)-like protein
VVANVELAKEKKESEELWKLSFYDPLTNLPNRRLLSDRMTQIMAASRRTGDHVALMMVDLDNFKPLNDLHGHVMGDLLLVDVGRRLMACVRGVDTVARFGGDEFVVVMGGLDVDRVKSTEQAREVAEKVRLSLSQPYLLKVPPADSPDRVIEHHCSVSVGVVVFVNHESNHDDVLKLADAAMYEAKAAGRNTIKFHETNGQLRMTAVRKTD